MKITKAASVELSGAPSAEQLEKINRLTKKAVTAEEVYVFSVRLCDDQVDRDDERFSESCIRELAALFIGKTGVMDHVWSAEKQVARIFDTEVLAENGATYLKGWAYMLRGAETDGLIREIDGGIKKEVSIGCAVKRRMCSICGAEYGACEHVKGETYGAERCAAVLCEAVDAYEFSFVAVPAQREAGVTKQFGMETDGERRCKQLEQQLQNRNALLNRVENSLRQEIVRLRFLVEGSAAQDAVSAAVERMSLEELLGFQETLRTKQKHLCQAQLRTPEPQEQNGAFRMG